MKPYYNWNDYDWYLIGTYAYEYESGPPWRKSMVNSYIWKKEDQTKADNGKQGKIESIPTLKC